MSITTFVNNIIKRIKGNEYTLDTSIPGSYLILLVLKRVQMLLRGKISCIQNGGLLFIGKKVELNAKSLMYFGKGVTINDFCLIDGLSTKGIIFGNNVSLGKRTVIECTGSMKHLGIGIKVGDNVGLGWDCYYGCAGGIEIAADTIIGNFVSFHSENHNVSDLAIPIRLQGVNHKGIKVGSNCWLGAKVIILDGAIIRDGCIIAAGAVVTSGIYESNSIYAGVPAKFIKKRF